MTTEQKEGNEMIAKFLGWWHPETKNTNEHYRLPKEFQRYSFTDILLISESDYLKFHSSWDWLLPVVEKIEESATIKIEHRRNQSPAHWCWIWANHDENPESVGFSNSKIESIWIAVVDYVRFVEQKAFEDAINETEKLLSDGTTPPPNKA
jgi:hypothetical protein